MADTGYESAFKLRKAFEAAEAKHKESLAALSALKRSSPKLVGGTIVFVDLAVTIMINTRAQSMPARFKECRPNPKKSKKKPEKLICHFWP